MKSSFHNPRRYRRRPGTYTQGSVDPHVPHEIIVHLDDTDERRITLGTTEVRRVLCRNGGYHITMTKDPRLVTCPVCLAKLLPAK